MKQFEVRWRFWTDPGNWQRIAMVVARDRMHAEERVWLHHVSASQLRNRIEFVSVEEM